MADGRKLWRDEKINEYQKCSSGSALFRLAEVISRIPIPQAVLTGGKGQAAFSLH